MKLIQTRSKRKQFDVVAATHALDADWRRFGGGDPGWLYLPEADQSRPPGDVLYGRRHP